MTASTKRRSGRLASSSRSERGRRAAYAALLAFACVASRARAGEPIVVTGRDGAEQRLALQDGEAALIVHFWASWCPDCAHELPALARVAAGCAGAVQVAAVNIGESTEAAEAFLARHGVALPLLRDPDGKLWRKFARGLPANLIRTRESDRVVTGPYSESAWGQELRALGCPIERPE